MRHVTLRFLDVLQTCQDSDYVINHTNNDLALNIRACDGVDVGYYGDCLPQEEAHFLKRGITHSNSRPYKQPTCPQCIVLMDKALEAEVAK